MLRPATPLTILLFSAFVLLLISVISTPIIQAIPLASYGGVNFGVFGYCQNGKCSKIEVGYNTGKFTISNWGFGSSIEPYLETHPLDFVSEANTGHLMEMRLCMERTYTDETTYSEPF
jgi:hypothetical protein